MAQLPKRGGTKVRQLALFPVRPQVLDRVQFRRIGREKLQPQASSLLLHKVPHGAAAMARKTIPDDQQFAGNVALQMREKLDDLRTANRTGKQPEVEVPPRHARDGRQHLPVEMILQHRRLSSWRPGTAAVWALAQSAFVDEDDRSAFFFGLFFNSGQRFCFQIRIFSSSRSKARPAGR